MCLHILAFEALEEEEPACMLLIRAPGWVLPYIKLAIFLCIVRLVTWVMGL